MRADGECLGRWVSRLVRIPSVNPLQAGPRAGAPGEAALAAELAAQFSRLGGRVVRDEVQPGRPNVYAIWSGRSERWAAVDVHMDTVGVEQMTADPFSGEVRDGRVYGRGAVDTKATLGVVLALLEELRASGSAPEANLLVAATIDEETGATGAPAFAEWVRKQPFTLDELAVAEPTECGPVVGHRGALRMEVRVLGEPAHSSQPHLGKNAIAAAARLVQELEAEHQRLQAHPAEGPLGAGTLTVTLIEGGTGANVVPDSCVLCLDRRVVPGEEPGEVERSLVELIRRSCPLPVETRVAKQIDPFLQAPGTPWVRRLVEWSGREAAVAPYGTNAWAYGGLARECVILGPGSIDQAHGVEEWVEIGELEKLAGIYRRWWGMWDPS